MTLQLQYSWGLFLLTLLLTGLWCCGLTAITQPGKIGFFVREFLTRKRPKRVACLPGANEKYDNELRSVIEQYESDCKGEADKEKIRIGAQAEIIEWLLKNGLFTEQTSFDILVNLKTSTTESFRKFKERHGINPFKSVNKYFYDEQVPLFSWHITDPLLTCITCMASVHSLIVYRAVTFYKGMSINPLEWVALAICAAYVNELLWFSLKKIKS